MGSKSRTVLLVSRVTSVPSGSMVATSMSAVFVNVPPYWGEHAILPFTDPGNVRLSGNIPTEHRSNEAQRGRTER